MVVSDWRENPELKLCAPGVPERWKKLWKLRKKDFDESMDATRLAQLVAAQPDFDPDTPAAGEAYVKNCLTKQKDLQEVEGERVKMTPPEQGGPLDDSEIIGDDYDPDDEPDTDETGSSADENNAEAGGSDREGTGGGTAAGSSEAGTTQLTAGDADSSPYSAGGGGGADTAEATGDAAGEETEGEAEAGVESAVSAGAASEEDRGDAVDTDAETGTTDDADTDSDGDDGGDSVATLDGGTETQDAVTDQLLEENTTTCWTCGSTVEIEQIEAIIKRLREPSERKFGTIESIDDELAEFEADQRELKRQRERRSDLEQAFERIERLDAKRESLQATIEELESDVTALETREYDEVLNKHREANQLEFEIERLQSDIDETTEEIASIEARLGERTQLEAERDEIILELTELRIRIDRLEAAAVDEFNEQMEAVLELLEYRNIERIWIERVEREVREGRRTVIKGVFELHVVRSSKAGAVYEDTVDILSESEREVMGLIFALARYLTHEVYRSVRSCCWTHWRPSIRSASERWWTTSPTMSRISPSRRFRRTSNTSMRTGGSSRSETAQRVGSPRRRYE